METDQPTPEDREEARFEHPHVYIASLSDYNAGTLHGAWVDAAQEPEQLEQAVTAMLSRSPVPGAEEFAIHDHEGFGGLQLSEYESLETISRLGFNIAEHGPAFAAWAGYVNHADATAERFEEAYLGEWDSVTDWAASQLLDDLGLVEAIEAAVPEWLRAYVDIDCEAFARDLELGGDILAIDRPDRSGVWLFHGGV